MIARAIVAAFALVFAMSCFGGTLTRTSAFEYDPASGLLIREVIEPDNSALCLVTTYVYDAYGNPISIVASTGDGYSKTTTNTFAAPDEVNWFIGRLTRSTVTSVTP